MLEIKKILNNINIFLENIWKILKYTFISSKDEEGVEGPKWEKARDKHENMSKTWIKLRKRAVLKRDAK